MATQDTKICQSNKAAFLLLLCLLMGMNFLAAVFGSSVQYCYSGRDINTQDALLNQTCETMETRFPQTLIATDSTHDGASDSLKVSGNHSTMSSPDGSNCLIFRHIASSYLSSGLKKESIRVTFGCDFDSVCVGKEANAVLDNVVIRGQAGKLYCCSSDNCNSMDKMPHTPAENRICYNGSNNSSKVGLESCSRPDVFCVKVTYFAPEGKQETYYCDRQDSQKLCKPSSINGAYMYCENRTVDGVVRQMCCCDNNKCNHPSDPQLRIPDHNEDSSLGGVKGGITHPIGNPQASEKKNNKVITGLVVAIVVLVLAGIAVVIVTAYKKGKQRKAMRRDPNVIMQYERLSASEPDVEEAVVV